MKTENEIKTALLNEVIDIVYEEIRSADQGMNIYLPLNHLLTKFHSLLPKEEPIDWSKASIDEKLKEAEKYIGEYAKDIDRSKDNFGVKKVESLEDYGDGDIWAFVDVETKLEPVIQLYCRERNQWAEIVEEPEKGVSKLRDELNETFKESYNVDLTWKPEPTQEIKAGDVVNIIGIKSKIYTVIHIDGNNAWIKNADQNYGSLVRLSDLRKPDPDKVYREIAKEIMKKKSLTCDKYGGREGMTYHEFDNEFLQGVLIEALKKGKEL